MHIEILSRTKSKSIMFLRKAAEKLETAAIYVERWQFTSPEEKRILSVNKEFKNKHSQQRAFVIGNGSSLLQQDLRLLSNEITFATNAFWKHPVVEEWQPKYYILLDYLYFDGSRPSNNFFEEMRNRINTSIIFLPMHERPAIRKLNLLPEAQIRYIRYAGQMAHMLFPRLDLTRSIGSGASVSSTAILIALYMGCNPIYLIGLDHDWLAHRGVDRHFYEGADLENHPKMIYDLSSVPYKRDMQSQLTLWKDYENLKRIAELCGIKILNATAGGFLDVFDRIDYASLF